MSGPDRIPELPSSELERTDRRFISYPTPQGYVDQQPREFRNMDLLYLMRGMPGIVNLYGLVKHDRLTTFVLEPMGEPWERRPREGYTLKDFWNVLLVLRRLEDNNARHGSVKLLVYPDGVRLDIIDYDESSERSSLMSDRAVMSTERSALAALLPEYAHLLLFADPRRQPKLCKIMIIMNQDLPEEMREPMVR